MPIIDISLPVHPHMATYLNERKPEFTPQDPISETNSFLTTLVSLLTHTGTHIDAPTHLLGTGLSIDQISLEKLVGDAIVYLADTPEAMTLFAFQKTILHSVRNKIVLFKTGTGTSLLNNRFDHQYLTPTQELVEFLIKSDIKAVGIDTLSIEGLESSEVVIHPLFLDHEIPIIEGLYLENVDPGEYQFICLPLKLVGLDGSPARAILISE